jgi:hypothetical protein
MNLAQAAFTPKAALGPGAECLVCRLEQVQIDRQGS